MKIKTEKISYFELMCLWYTGKYPKRIIYKDEVWTIFLNKDYKSRSGKLLGVRISDLTFKNQIDEKCIEILDFEELG